MKQVNPLHDRLELRIGAQHLRDRLAIERSHVAGQFTLAHWRVPQRWVDFGMQMLEHALKLSGLWHLGRRNGIAYRVTENKPHFPNLPAAFRGYRILHLSDLHIEAIPDGCESLRRILLGIQADLCVVTGDFRFGTSGASDEAIQLLKKLFEGLAYADGVFAVLGNHDGHDLIEGLEEIGVRTLVNEAVCIERGGDSLALAGVDDPHYFKLHDVKKALAGVEPERFKILLAHSPEIAEEATREGVSFYLCGHSHGGQICLPNGQPILANLRCSRRLFSGAWHEAGMHGYTSHGTGSSGVPVRFFSRPEITIHELNEPK